MIMLGIERFSHIPLTRLMEWDLDWVKTAKESVGFIFKNPIIFSKEDRVEQLKKYDVGF